MAIGGVIISKNPNNTLCFFGDLFSVFLVALCISISFFGISVWGIDALMMMRYIRSQPVSMSRISQINFPLKTYGEFVINTEPSLMLSFQIGDPNQRPMMNKSKYQFTNKGDKKAAPEVLNKDSEIHRNPNSYLNSYSHAVKKGNQSQSMEGENKPAIVLDETCVNEQDFSKSLMGKVKEFFSLSHLKVVLANEGFDNIKLKYMGGYWVLIEFESEVSKEKFKTHVGIGSWFSQIQQASNEFHIEERVTWEDCFHSKVFWIRAKEVPGWIPDFVEEEEEDNDSDSDPKDD
ncbi:hypothetical protein Tco_0921370 [Tanacetum coccineum]